VVSHELPYLPTREGVWLFDPEARGSPAVIAPEALRFVSWQELGPVTAQRTAVRAGRRLIFRARSPRGALQVAVSLEALRQAPELEREARWAAAQRAALDVTSARARWKRLRRPLAVTSAFSGAEFLLLFGALPYVAFWSTTELRWERTLLALLWAHLGTLVGAAWTLKRAGTPAAAVASTVFTLAIFPAYAARASAQLLRDAFLEWEPLAVAAALLPAPGFAGVARQEYVRAQESQHATAAVGLGPFWAARRIALDASLQAAGTSSAEVLAPPALSAGARSWCALCLAEYRDGFAECSDCQLSLQHAAPGQS